MNARPCVVPGCPALTVGEAWDTCTVHMDARTAAQSGVVDWECYVCGEKFKEHELVALPDYGKHTPPGRKHAADCKPKQRGPTKKQRAKTPKPLFEGLNS